METLSAVDFALRLGVGVGCGALIGLERQWRARRAGLRTNALVAGGATLFVLYAAATSDSSPTRVASYVVSGIGFLGGGVILREGVNVRGLNTAATLWCSAAIGVLAASGHLVFALIGTGTVIGIHVLGRPLGRLIDRDNSADEDESLLPYLVQVVCRPKHEKYARPDRSARRRQRHHASRDPHRASGRRRDHLDRPPADGRRRPRPAGAAGGRAIPAAGRSRGPVVRRRRRADRRSSLSGAAAVVVLPV